MPHWFDRAPARRPLTLAACLVAGLAVTLPGTALAQYDGKAVDKMADTAAKALKQPDSVASFAQLVDPKTLTVWVQVLTSPDTLEALLKQGNPENLARWAEVMTNPAVVGNVLKATDPALIQQWVR